MHHKIQTNERDFKTRIAWNRNRLRPWFVTGLGKIHWHEFLKPLVLDLHSDSDDSSAEEPLPSITFWTIFKKCSDLRSDRSGSSRKILAVDTEKELVWEKGALQIMRMARLWQASSSCTFSKLVPRVNAEQYSNFGLIIDSYIFKASEVVRKCLIFLSE